MAEGLASTASLLNRRSSWRTKVAPAICPLSAPRHRTAAASVYLSSSARQLTASAAPAEAEAEAAVSAAPPPTEAVEEAAAAAAAAPPRRASRAGTIITSLCGPRALTRSGGSSSAPSTALRSRQQTSACRSVASRLACRRRLASSLPVRRRQNETRRSTLGP